MGVGRPYPYTGYKRLTHVYIQVIHESHVIVNHPGKTKGTHLQPPKETQVNQPGRSEGAHLLSQESYLNERAFSGEGEVFSRECALAHASPDFKTETCQLCVSCAQIAQCSNCPVLLAISLGNSLSTWTSIWSRGTFICYRDPRGPHHHHHHHPPRVFLSVLLGERISPRGSLVAPSILVVVFDVWQRYK